METGTTGTTTLPLLCVILSLEMQRVSLCLEHILEQNVITLSFLVPSYLLSIPLEWGIWKVINDPASLHLSLGPLHNTLSGANGCHCIYMSYLRTLPENETTPLLVRQFTPYFKWVCKPVIELWESLCPAYKLSPTCCSVDFHWCFHAPSLSKLTDYLSLIKKN